jgi:molecular chaperone DnaK (HSP70)
VEAASFHVPTGTFGGVREVEQRRSHEHACFQRKRRLPSYLRMDNIGDEGRLVSDTPLEERGIGVGIDLGTTNSAVAVLVNGEPTMLSLPNNAGNTVASVISILMGTTEEEPVVSIGKEAIEQEMTNPSGTYRNVKRIIGTGGKAASMNAPVVPNMIQSTPNRKTVKNKYKQYKSKSKDLSLAQQLKDAEENPALLALPRAIQAPEISAQQNGGDTVVQSRETITPEQISAYLLRYLFNAAERFHDESGTSLKTVSKVTRAVVGVPAYFNDAQRDATLRACRLAGVPKARLLREPEAAALAYDIGRRDTNEDEKNNASDELVLVFDLGGGTFDVSVLAVGGGLTEVVATGGNNMLGGSDFDTRISELFVKFLMDHGCKTNFRKAGGDVADVMVRCAEAVRIHLSNNRAAKLALPLTADGWRSISHASNILMDMSDVTTDAAATEEGTSNSTHVLCTLTRRSMERACLREFQALLQPLREVAIMAGALLPGDSRPSIVEAAFELEEELELAMSNGGGSKINYEDFYDEEQWGGSEKTPVVTENEDSINEAIMLELQAAEIKAKKLQQQRGRKKARSVAVKERVFREEKKKAATSAQVSSDVKVRDGISGRPLSRIVLVGGATRMPAIGRLLAALTGVVPQKTVNPDEAVALGCAVQVGVLDGDAALGGLQVLTPIQAALMRALAKKRGMDDVDGDDFDDEEFV